MIERLYSHVLVPTDFRPECQAAYRVAFAAALGSGSKVSLLYVVPEPAPDEYQGLDAIRLLHRAAEHKVAARPPAADAGAEHARHMDRLRAEVHPDWVGPIEFHLEVRRGDPTAEIARYAHEAKVDLIVTAGARPGFLPSIGRGLSDRLARATAAKIIRVTPPLRG